MSTSTFASLVPKELSELRALVFATLKHPKFTNGVQVRLTVEQWRVVPDNPRQRNTELHLSRVIDTLRNPSPTQMVVAMAVERYGWRRIWKLDGHTRNLLWTKEPHLAPEHLNATIYEVENEAGAAELYTHHDSRSAVETSSDQTFGAYRESGVLVQSKMMRNARIVTALHLAEAAAVGMRGRVPGATPYSLVKNWKNEIELIDTITPVPHWFTHSIFFAAVMTIRRRGAEALSFWDLYNQDKGVKGTEEMDGVEALHRMVQDHRNCKDKIWLAGRAISCFETWRTHNAYSTKKKASGARYTPPEKYLTEQMRQQAMSKYNMTEVE